MRRETHTSKLKVFGLFLLMLAVICICGKNIAYAADTAQWVIDDADLLSDSEESRLQEACEKIYQSHGISTVIVTTMQYDGSDMETWQDALYETQKFGKAADADCLIFGISMAERDWQFTVYGSALDIFNAYVREDVAGNVISYFSDGDFYQGFKKYLEESDRFMTEAEKGNYYSASKPYKKPVPIVPIIIGAFILSLIISFIVVSSWKAGMNTKILQTGAASYLKKNSFRLRTQQDMFLYHQVRRTKREREERSGGSHGSMHSSGHGTGGKF